MTDKIKTYGKANPIIKEWVRVKELRTFNPHTRALLSNSGLREYKPRLSRSKLIIGMSIITLCLLTPFTNLLIPFITRWGLR